MTKLPKNLDNVRQYLLGEILKAERHISLKTLSIAAGKNPAYLHQFIYRGSPRLLPEDVRHKIASILGVSEYTLRHPGEYTQPDNTLIRYLDHPSQKDFSDGPWHVPHSLLNDTLKLSVSDIRLAVVGDTTHDFSISCGDIIMMNVSDKNPLTAGYFALNAGSHIRVRHLEQVGQKDKRIIISGNGSMPYSSLDTLDDILGRVVFHAHIFSTMPKQPALSGV